MNQPSPTIMRLAFERATADIPRPERTRTYAMIRSALNRRLGLHRRRKGWNVSRRDKRR